MKSSLRWVRLPSEKEAAPLQKLWNPGVGAGTFPVKALPRLVTASAGHQSPLPCSLPQAVPLCVPMSGCPPSSKDSG